MVTGVELLLGVELFLGAELLLGADSLLLGVELLLGVKLVLGVPERLLSDRYDRQQSKFLPLKSTISRIQYNLLYERDIYTFWKEENADVACYIGLDKTVYISPRAVEFKIYPKTVKYDVIYFSEIPTSAFADNLVSGFIKEVVEEGRDFRETALYHENHRRKKKFRRRTGDEGARGAATHLTSDELFEKYHRRCLWLAESMRSRGMVDFRSDAAKLFREPDAVDDNPHVLIDGSGRLIHRRFGKHRLSMASIIGLREVPVIVSAVSGAFLLKFMPGWQAFDPGRLPAAVGEALSAAGASDVPRKHNIEQLS